MTPNDVKTVADNIDDFIEVPNGVERLRKAVLTLAVSGKLVAQDKSEGTAESLYSKAYTERLGRQKKAKDFASVAKEEAPFGIPASWKWVRIREITHDSGQKTPDKDFCYVDVSSIDSSRGIIVEPKYLKASEAPSRARKCVEDKSVIYSGVRPYLLNTAIVDLSKIEKEVIVSTAFFVLNPYAEISSEYIHLLVRSPYFDELANKACVGAAYPAINDDKFEKLPVPLPPLQEQRRIVKKVEEVMNQLDELDAKKCERDEVRARLVRSAMQSLGKGEPKIAFEHLAGLIKTPADIKEFEGALLTLAVSGKLVPQDKKDGTAEELYVKIQSEIGGGVRGRKKKTNESALISAEDLPFDIPKSWKWVRLMEIGKLDTGKTPRTGVTGNYAGDIPFVGPGDVQRGKINSYSKLVTKQGASESKYLYPGDVLMVCIGGTIGKTALVTSTHTFNQQINKITPCLVDSTFLFCVFQSGYFQRLVWSKASGGATPLVNLTRWSSCVVPLPPLVEQKRIVKKVEEVMNLVEQLRDVIGESKAGGRGRPKK